MTTTNEKDTPDHLLEQHDGLKLSTSKPVKQTPLPLPQITTLFVLLFANAAISTAPYPFLPFMVTDLGVSIEEAGSAVGLIAGGRFAGNMLCSWLWGVAADRWGRRPCILISVTSQCICTLVFAYSTAQSVALSAAARTLGGALNGAVPIAKTYVSEITDSTNQGKAMTLITASWGAGLVIGPALGGFLCKPAEKYPSLDYPILRAYPYALPMVSVAGICAIATVLGWMFLKETLDRSKMEDAVAKADAEKFERTTENKKEPTSPLFQAWIPPLLRDPTRFTVVLLYTVLSVQAIGFDEMYNVWLATPLEAGGMGYTTDEIGTTLVIYGLTAIFATSPVYQTLEKRLGMLVLFRWMSVVAAVCYLSLPLLPRVAGYFGYGPRSSLTWTALVMTGMVSRVANGITFVTQAVFSNNSVGQFQRGAMNGLSMTFAATVRSFTPLFFGWTYGVTLTAGKSWPLDSSLVFTLVAAFMLHAGHISVGLPPSIEKQHS